MFYYTTALKARLDGDVDNVANHLQKYVATANLAYYNSDIPLTMKLFCMEEAVGLEETGCGASQLYNFIAHKGIAAAKEKPSIALTRDGCVRGVKFAICAQRGVAPLFPV